MHRSGMGGRQGSEQESLQVGQRWVAPYIAPRCCRVLTAGTSTQQVLHITRMRTITPETTYKRRVFPRSSTAPLVPQRYALVVRFSFSTCSVSPRGPHKLA